MTNELQPQDGSQALKEIATTIGAIINPLAEQQAAAQIEQIRAADRQHERAMAEMGKENQRRFRINVGVLAFIGASMLALLIVTQKVEPLLYALTYLGGGVTGYGYARFKLPGAAK